MFVTSTEVPRAYQFWCNFKRNYITRLANLASRWTGFLRLRVDLVNCSSSITWLRHRRVVGIQPRIWAMQSKLSVDALRVMPVMQTIFRLGRKWIIHWFYKMLDTWNKNRIYLYRSFRLAGLVFQPEKKKEKRRTVFQLGFCYIFFGLVPVEFKDGVEYLGSVRFCLVPLQQKNKLRFRFSFSWVYCATSFRREQHAWVGPFQRRRSSAITLKRFEA